MILKAEPFTDIEDAGFRSKLASKVDEAYLKFYYYYYPRIFSLIKRDCPGLDDEDITEITKNTLEKIPGKMNTFSYLGPGQFSSWVLTIALNEARGVQRKNTRRKILAASIDTQEITFKDLDNPILLKEIQEKVELLPPSDQRIIIARYRLGLSFKVIALRLGTSVAKARAKHDNALKKLKRLCGMV